MKLTKSGRMLLLLLLIGCWMLQKESGIRNPESYSGRHMAASKFIRSFGANNNNQIGGTKYGNSFYTEVANLFVYFFYRYILLCLVFALQ